MALNINILTQNSNISYDTPAPYSYNEWLQRNPSVSYDTSVKLYNEYIAAWYAYTKTSKTATSSVKQDYINLLKELTYFFSEEEKNLFLKDIDFNNDVEIVYAIPFFVQKLKQIALNIAKKRNTIKNSKAKYGLIGSDYGLEKTLYEYILKSYTSSSNTTQISISSLGSTFPDLSAVSDSFIIEIEDIYDTSTYGDFDPTSSADILGTLPQIADNPLFSVLTDFLTAENIQLTAYNNYTTDSIANIYNEITLNTKYLGSTVYGISAVKYDLNTPDDSIMINMLPGNNWFYWPSGEVFTDIEHIQNTYEPISLQSSVLTAGTASTDYTSSDLLFVESRGTIEGAWLKGSITTQTSGTMVMTAQPKEIRSFIYPKPGYGLTSTYKWSGRVLDDNGLIPFNLLDPSIRTNIVKKYFSAGIDQDVIESTYINNTNLVYSKANADSSSFTADTLLQRPGGPYNDITQLSSLGIYNDTNLTHEAFLYKLTSAELPIVSGDNKILWPITSTDLATIANSDKIKITADTCNEVHLGSIDINQYMIGAVAGRNIDEADKIYKLTRVDGTPIEAAWLNGGSVKDLAYYNSYSIPVYDTPAVNCVNMPDGAIQPNLSFLCAADTKASFVWCDVDTPADEVFKYIPHALDCPYIQTAHDYSLKNADAEWSTCTCKSVVYSPVGHTGETLTDNYGMADYLFADPQGLGESFTITKWRDTRNYNYKTSPQFAYFKKSDNTVDKTVGWGPGFWKTGNGSKMILKTGRRYTYMRNGIRNLNADIPAPSMVARYPYKRIISGVQTSKTVDIILAIDISGSEYFSINKTKQLAKNIAEYVNTTEGSQVGVVAFNSTAATVSYLSRDKSTIIKAIDSIDINNTLVNSNITNGLEISNKLLTNIFGANKRSLSSLCSNLNLAIDIPSSLSLASNLPGNGEKIIILFSDGAENINSAIDVATALKNNNTKIISVDIGPNSSVNNLMERIASSSEYYYNYELALLQDEYNKAANVFANSIIAGVYGNVSVQPTWRKAVYSGSVLIESNDVSDMLLRPGDFLKYSHAALTTYDTFTCPSAAFIINVPLYGWNYDTATFDRVSLGAKPYWGKSYNYPDSTIPFTKFTTSAGGYIRFVNDYLPISHPEISDILLTNNDYIEYRNKGCTAITWSENISFSSIATTPLWCKLKACTQISNLKDIFTNTSIDKIFEQTDEPSNITLTTYREYTPAYYCYFARNEFTATQPLFYIYKHQTFAQINSSVLIIPTEPYLNLTNTRYASIAYAPNQLNFITKKDVGEYLLPLNLGVPYYLGRGFTNELSIDKLSKMDGKAIFLDPDAYTSNRGLTKKDQESPYETTSIDNSWFKESYNSGKKSGAIINSSDYQKFVPYQSNYESSNYNIYGISRQHDSFEFWTGPNNNIWADEEHFATNYKKEPYQIQEKTDSLIVTDDVFTIWRTDIFGNNYGVLKNITNLSRAEAENAPGKVWVRDVFDSLKIGSDALYNIYSQYANLTSFYDDLINERVIDLDVFGDTLLLRTVDGIAIAKVLYSYDTGKFSMNSHVSNFISLKNDSSIPDIIGRTVYGGLWYDEFAKKVYICTLNFIRGFTLPTEPQSTIIQTNIYEFDINRDQFKQIFVDYIQSPQNIANFSSVKTPTTFTYNADTLTFNISFIFDTFKIYSIDVKNITDNPYIIRVNLGV